MQLRFGGTLGRKRCTSLSYLGSGDAILQSREEKKDMMPIFFLLFAADV